MAKLYELVSAIENFEFEIDDETGEILNMEALDQLELDKQTKVENICLWIKNLRSDAEAFNVEAKSFQTKRANALRKAESLESYLNRVLNGEKFKTTRVAISYRKSEAVECENLLDVDHNYLRFKEPELDKNKVKAALKSGIPVRGCSLITRQSMTIR